MILGKFVDGRVVLPVSFCLGNDTDLMINCVVDTGFNDYLTLPPQAVAAMGLPFYTTTVARLADGRKYSIPIHSARIRWNNREELVPVLATGIKPLLGTALLQGFRLIVEFANDGIVKIERM
jgi:clan AA aspartic protease